MKPFATFLVLIAAFCSFRFFESCAGIEFKPFSEFWTFSRNADWENPSANSQFTGKEEDLDTEIQSVFADIQRLQERFQGIKLFKGELATFSQLRQGDEQFSAAFDKFLAEFDAHIYFGPTNFKHGNLVGQPQAIGHGSQFGGIEEQFQNKGSANGAVSSVEK